MLLEKAPRPLLEGAFRRLPLPDLLQSLALGDPCQVLVIRGSKPAGFFWLSGKRVIRCRTIQKDGFPAFLELFKHKDAGGFRVYQLPSEMVPDGEEVGFLDALLLRAACEVDETGSLRFAARGDEVTKTAC